MKILFPDGYWPKEMGQSERDVSIGDFEHKIFPIWKGIEERDLEDQAKQEMREINSPGQVMFECETTHRQDIAIRRFVRENSEAGIVDVRPRRTSEPNEHEYKNRKAGDRFAGWKGS